MTPFPSLLLGTSSCGAEGVPEPCSAAPSTDKRLPSLESGTMSFVKASCLRGVNRQGFFLFIFCFGFSFFSASLPTAGLTFSRAHLKVPKILEAQGKQMLILGYLPRDPSGSLKSPSTAVSTVTLPYNVNY